MRTILTAGSLLLSSALLLAQDGDPASAEEVIKEVLVTFDQLTGSLKTVLDEKTAEAARPELRKAAQRFVELRKKTEAMKPPAKEERERLVKEYAQKLMEAKTKLFAEIGRVKLLPGAQGALKEIQAVVDPKKK